MVNIKRDPITGEIINPVETLQSNSVALVEEPKEISAKELKEAIESDSNLRNADDEEDDYTQVMIDSTIFTAFQECEVKYNYKFKQNLIPIEGFKKGINRGSAVHVGLADYWKERIKTGDYQVAVKAGIKACKGFMDKDINFTSEDKLGTLQTLLTFLQHIQSSSWIPIEVEKHFIFKVYENEREKLRIFLTGRIDLILRTPQIPILPVDNKTESERWFYSQMRNQFKIYAMACGVNIFGVQRIGFQEKVPIEQKFKMEMIPFDQDTLDEFREITIPYWIKRLIEVSNSGQYVMNTSSCVHGHWKCEFSDAYNGGICNVSRTVRQQKLERYFKKGEEWDPSKE